MANYSLDSEDRVSRATQSLDGFIEVMSLVPPDVTIAVHQIVAVLWVINDELNASLPKNWRRLSANDEE